jgi:hypothetical protein
MFTGPGSDGVSDGDTDPQDQLRVRASHRGRRPGRRGRGPGQLILTPSDVETG